MCGAEDMEEMLTQLEVDVGELDALMQLAGAKLPLVNVAEGRSAVPS